MSGFIRQVYSYLHELPSCLLPVSLVGQGESCQGLPCREMMETALGLAPLAVCSQHIYGSWDATL